MDTEYHLSTHPILDIPERKRIKFFWQGHEYWGFEGEPITSALYANGIRIFGHHIKDQSPQGIFCANGQCSQCLVFANGKPVKGCVTPLESENKLEPMDSLPVVSKTQLSKQQKNILTHKTPVLIIGGGPSGLSAAKELSALGIASLLIDDKAELGGKLVLQTHRFFGSSQSVFAGTRGIDIAKLLERQVTESNLVEVWRDSTALAVFQDQKVGVLKGNEYILVEPDFLLISCGAREKSLVFPGNSLPGVMGAGAFQTLLNRDLVKPASQVLIVGGGNVGLIAGYHALQAGIKVAALVEAMPHCGGYQVHLDKLHRLGVPILTSHTIVEARGSSQVESAVIAQLDPQFKPIPGTEKHIDVDAILVAIGLDPIDELYKKAVKYGMQVEKAGDADEIAEASAAIYSGKIKAIKIAHALGVSVAENDSQLLHTLNILKAKPGRVLEPNEISSKSGVMPVIHCRQEIPCDPCVHLCPKGFFYIDEQDIRTIPVFTGDSAHCIGCEKCVAGCPGLAITLVDYRKGTDKAVVSLAVEFLRTELEGLEKVELTDIDGNSIGLSSIIKINAVPKLDHTNIVKIEVPSELAAKVAGIRLQAQAVFESETTQQDTFTPQTIVCRCERVTHDEIDDLIDHGITDMNAIKMLTRAGMGACGGKTCKNLILRQFKSRGIADDQVTEFTPRPIFKEVELGIFAGEIDHNGGN